MSKNWKDLKEAYFTESEREDIDKQARVEANRNLVGKCYRYYRTGDDVYDLVESYLEVPRDPMLAESFIKDCLEGPRDEIELVWAIENNALANLRDLRIDQINVIRIAGEMNEENLPRKWIAQVLLTALEYEGVTELMMMWKEANATDIRHRKNILMDINDLLRDILDDPADLFYGKDPKKKSRSGVYT